MVKITSRAKANGLEAEFIAEIGSSDDPMKALEFAGAIKKLCESNLSVSTEKPKDAAITNPNSV